MADDTQVNTPIPASAGATPAAPAPMSSGGSSVDPQTAQLLQQLMGQASRPHQTIAPPPVSEKAKKPGLGKDIAMQALNMFVPFVGGAVQRAVKAERESQIAAAMNTLQNIDNELETAQYVSGGDPKKQEEYLNNSPKLKAIMADKKIRKQLQKVYGTDLLNPEKQNTVYHEAIKRHMELKPASELMKKMHGIMGQQQQGQPQQGGQPSPQGAQPAQGQPQPPQGQQPDQNQKTPAEMVASLPQRTIQPDLSKIASLDSALRRDSNAETTSLLRQITQIETERHHREEETLSGKKADETAAENKRRDERAKASLGERHTEFVKTDEYRHWKENLDVNTRVKVAEESHNKPPAMMTQIAEFASTGYMQLKRARVVMEDLQKKGVFNGPMKNKIEDAIFGNGWVDPSLDKDTVKKIGYLRTSLGGSVSAFLKAHTGRTALEYYKDYKQQLGIGQAEDALYGSMDAMGEMLEHYANAATPESLNELKTPAAERGAKKPALKAHEIPKAE